ncbi:MAG: hypothetical protein KDE27_15535, partial [Planctomycetes bacterium]|nr:hypothetical protein [Planctomycetota bacterium]
IAVGDPLRLAVQLVPRVAGKLQLDLEVAGRTGVARRLLQREVLDPATAPLLTVLRYLPFDAMKRGEPLCERATTVHEWRELRARLGGAAAALPDGWCSFHGSAIVAVVANADRVSAGFRFLVAEEEGVDVLTARQVGPSGRFVEQRSFGFVAVVPDRKGQLAVVLRRSFGPGPPTEKTLRVFAPVGR